ncbi:MAG: anti-sigma factor [Saprospiraceae bacterium]
MDKNQFLASGLLEQYVLGLTSSSETEEVEEWLRLYPELKQEVKVMHDALEKYSLSQGITPPPRLRSKVLNKLDSERLVSGLQVEPNLSSPTQGSRLMNWKTLIWPIAASLAVVILLVKNNDLSHNISSMQAELAQTKAVCEEEAKRFQAFIQHPATQAIKLKGGALAPDAAVTIYWNPDQRLAFLDTSTLPILPDPEKQFQIWADVEGEMINLGLLKQSAKETLQPIAFLEKTESLNLTLEPIGGSAHPHVEFLFASSPI